MSELKVKLLLNNLIYIFNAQTTVLFLSKTKESWKRLDQLTQQLKP